MDACNLTRRPHTLSVPSCSSVGYTALVSGTRILNRIRPHQKKTVASRAIMQSQPGLHCRELFLSSWARCRRRTRLKSGLITDKNYLIRRHRPLLGTKSRFDANAQLSQLTNSFFRRGGRHCDPIRRESSERNCVFVWHFASDKSNLEHNIICARRANDFIEAFHKYLSIENQVRFLWVAPLLRPVKSHVRR